MDETNNKILSRMLERLFAGLVSGPNLNCRPHSSRQRIDLTQVGKLADLAPERILEQLLGGARQARLTAQVTAPQRTARPKNGARPEGVSPAAGKSPPEDLSPEERAAWEAWTQQQAVLSKLRVLTDEARTYEQDTGAHVLNIGFPLLSLPPGSGPGGRGRTAKRILAPVAFIPVTITVGGGHRPTIDVACQGEGADIVSPNMALLAWLEQQTGAAAANLVDDAEGLDPWREIDAAMRHVAATLKLSPLRLPELMRQAGAVEGAGEPRATPVWQLQAAPRTDDEGGPRLVPAAVLGLFPMNNQGLLRDMQALVAGEALEGPVQSFVQLGLALDKPAAKDYEHEAWSGEQRSREHADERLVTSCDPCQSRAVKLARERLGLVIHGPPGSGKSQTITNIIGDHLSRGERVLMVCDKRTALDVVVNRLEHLGLGPLCALVHDPQRDQRELYRNIREQLENLSEQQNSGKTARQLGRLDKELSRLHGELTEYWNLVMQAPDGVDSFHELAGRWLSLADAPDLSAGAATGASLDDWQHYENDIGQVLERSAGVRLMKNPWRQAAGCSLQELLARPMEQLRRDVRQCAEAAQAADATAHASIPPLEPTQPWIEQGDARRNLADKLELLLAAIPPYVRRRWAGESPANLRRANQQLAAAAPSLEVLLSAPLDAELELTQGGQPVSIAALAEPLLAVEAYLEKASLWYSWLYFTRRSEAARALARHGLRNGPGQAERLRTYLIGKRARLVLSALCRELQGPATGTPAAQMEALSDDALERRLTDHAAIIHLLLGLEREPALAGLTSLTRQALEDETAARAFIDGLRRSAPRATALNQLASQLEQTQLFEPGWLTETKAAWAAGGLAAEILVNLAAELPTLDGVLRVRRELDQLPAALATATRDAIRLACDDPDVAKAAVERAVVAAAMQQRLQDHPQLQDQDPQRLEACLERYRVLEQQKKALVRDVVQAYWLGRQQERLLASTGSRLNGAGADVRRRLTMRGDRAMRLRQVVAAGQNLEGGDPLFDLRPVWLASPETVAQVFPRSPLFDVVIFDEASQCRLEEALPVLTRGRRVVIAGDPKQLPPTRFFESALSISEEQEPETDQELFETQQSEVEDLLTAALGLEIQQCYLDVHYRSSNADLIEFSNRQFYSSRLQAIPGHPSRRARFAPITLHRANGVYDERANLAEANEVCRIANDLLKWAEPPSIGIACFNLTQRDLIVERLEALAAEDAEFGSRLAEARTRRGEGSFEGLFVKNLENVQGDERDHIIISTTYGPDPNGRFYQRFGPLGRAGGGRRLNVLVTRARQEVHLVTSIPPGVYRSLPPAPAGQVPGGGWLLFSYLAFAEQLQQLYEIRHENVAQEARGPKAVVHEGESRTPSDFASALARRLADQHNQGSDVYWGNEGFCIDVALHHPRRAHDVTLGLLCDGARFQQAEDRVEWDLFRTGVLAAQDWRLHRLWTPHFFRDPQGCLDKILALAAEEAQREAPE